MTRLKPSGRLRTSLVAVTGGYERLREVTSGYGRLRAVTGGSGVNGLTH